MIEYCVHKNEDGSFAIESKGIINGSIAVAICNVLVCTSVFDLLKGCFVRAKGIYCQFGTQAKTVHKGIQVGKAQHVKLSLTKIIQDMLVGIAQMAFDGFFQCTDSALYFKRFTAFGAKTILRVDISIIELFNDIIHRFSPPLHGAGQPSDAD